MLGSIRLHYLKEKFLVVTVNKFSAVMYTDLDSFLISSGCCLSILQQLDTTFVPWYANYASFIFVDWISMWVHLDYNTTQQTMEPLLHSFCTQTFITVLRTYVNKSHKVMGRLPVGWNVENFSYHCIHTVPINKKRKSAYNW